MSDAEAASSRAESADGGTPERTPRADPAIGEGLLDENMGPSSAMAHLYRGEIHRMKLWRQRLDRTTNWAVLLIAGVLTWAFSSETNPHYVILVGGAGVLLFAFVEARRYRAYEVWRSRVRALQRYVWAVGLDPEGSRDDLDDSWRERLAADYRSPELQISTEEALAHRLRRVYFPLFTVIAGAWVLRVTAFSDLGWPASAAVGQVSGLAVTAVVAGGYLAAAVVCCRPRTWHTRGELLEENLRTDRTE